MKILYVHQYFKTPAEPGGTRSYWIAQEMIKRGHQVVMVTSTNTRRPNQGVEIVDGIEVHYMKNEYSNYMSIPQKIFSFLKFIGLAIKESKRQKGIDLVFATSTPLTIGYIALQLKRSKGWKYIFEVRDLWPEFPIQMGAIKNKVTIKVLKWLEKKIYEEAEHIIALSPGMKDGVVATGISSEKCTMIPNMSKPDEFYPHQPSKEIAHKFGINMDNFNIVHFGSMGKANGLSYIIETAKSLSDKGVENIDFIFMGDGATCPILKKQVEDLGLKNVKFLGSHPMKIVVEVVNCCDVSITSFLDLPILYTNSPNKLFDSLSAGKPIIVNSAGWTKDLVEKDDCGFYVDPQNPQDFVDKILKYYQDKELLQKWSQNARKLSIEVYDKNILTKKVVDVIEKQYEIINK